MMRGDFTYVDQSLRDLRISDPQLDSSYHSETLNNNGRGNAPNPKRRRIRVTAPQYVAKMDISPERVSVVCELANRFDDKSFLPTFGDIRNFCKVYGIAEPASKSRVSAIPRVFKFIATMEAGDAREILDYGMFSGPSRLGPYCGRDSRLRPRQ